MNNRRLLRLMLLSASAIGILTLGSFLAKPSMERNALVFGQSVGKLLVAGGFSLPLLGLLLLCIWTDRIEIYVAEMFGSRWFPEAVPSRPQTVRRIYVVSLVLVSVVVALAFFNAPVWGGSSNPLHIGLTRTRYLLLWTDLVLAALPLLAFLGLSRKSWALLTKPSTLSSPVALGGISWKDAVLVFLTAVIVVGAVYHDAWVSEDSFITLRYVSNAEAGYGPVFNVGERVQGYTHPLWFGLLLLGSSLGANPVFLSIGYGLTLTFLTVLLLGLTLSRLVHRRAIQAILLAVSSLPWILSEPWLSFQTSGLENSLSNLLIMALLIEVWVQGMRRPARILLLASLLALTRPDFLVLTAPLLVLLIPQLRHGRSTLASALAVSPAIAWLLFARTYYGTVVPNTAYAKLGIYPNWSDAIAQGLRYFEDWLYYDRVAALGALLLIAYAFVVATSKERMACIAGVVLYGVYVVWIGGDFMRGRMLTPALTAGVVLGSLALAEKISQARDTTAPLHVGVALCLVVGLLLVHKSTPDPGAAVSDSGIVNERRYYPGYQLSSILARGHLENPYLDLRLAADLRRFAQLCGHVTIHSRNPGTIGYLAGPSVSIIDTLGLTDAYIARLPREYMISSRPRPGHPDKFIPISYLISKGDVRLLPGWMSSLKSGDCSLTDQLAGVRPTSDLYDPR